jgi:CRISPR-associated endonuclease/helicase Cas3
MAQRLGRVNRFGDRDDTRIDIVHPSEFEKDDFEQRLEKTLELLRQLSGDGSPAALGKLDPEERVAAFAPTPTILPTSDILFDAWALTTIKDKLPGRPPVEPYLHGLPTDWQPPETQVAWRKEVGIITLDLLNTNKPEDLLEDYPLKPHELLKDRSRRVFERLKKLKASPELPVWIVSNDGAVEVTTLGEITNQDDDAIAYRTVLLPEEAGGLEKGTLTSESRTASDVADDWSDDKGLLRKRIWKGEDNPPKMKIVREIVFDEDSESSKVWLWFVRPKSEDAANARSKEPYPLQPHLDDAKEAATSIVDRLNLPEPLRSAGAEETSALARRRKAL